MKIVYKQADLLECDENILIHGCNAQGVMGSGVAKAVRNKYPEAYDTYLIHRNNYKMGSVLFAEGRDGKLVGNAITQYNYGRCKTTRYVDYDALRKVMRYLNETFCGETVAMPKIGAGLANGDWNIIEKIIEEECTDVQPVVYVLGDNK